VDKINLVERHNLPAAIIRMPSTLPHVLVNGLGSVERAALQELRPTVRRVQDGQTLYDQGDAAGSVYILLDGWAFRYRVLGDGRRQIVDFTLPGALLGYGVDRTMTHGVEARTVCDFWAIPRAQFEQLLVRYPRLAMRVVELLARNEAIALERLMTLGRQSARERIAHLLVELIARAREAGKRVTERGFTLPLTQTHIADATGLTAVHVCRTLAVLRKSGLCVLRNGRLQILDMKKLIVEAGFGTDDPMPWAAKFTQAEPVALRVA
jgi:CRP/FNR family transcriptional regulator, anaerobic regulatory protein